MELVQMSIKNFWMLF